MEIQIKWKYAEGTIDTKDMKLICIKARGKRTFASDEIDAEIAIEDGFNLVIANIHTGETNSSNALCEEIVRRFNEFPEDLKR